MAREAVLLLVLLIASSYAYDSRHSMQGLKSTIKAKDSKQESLNPSAAPEDKSVPATPSFRAKNKAQAKTAQAQNVQAKAQAQAHVLKAQGKTTQTQAHKAKSQEGAHVLAVAKATVMQDSSTGGDASSSTAREKGTPGARCNTYTTCVECTDDEALSFYCMWSAARNVCQEDTDMDKIKRAQPEDLWTKQCAPKEPIVIADPCTGCPIPAVDKKPDRDIVDSTIKGSNGDYSLATEGKLNILGTDPNDPITGPITHPNGTFGPIYTLPSIKDENGNIKDPVQDKEKLTYSPCVGDGSCGASSMRFVSSMRKGKFTPILVGSDEDRQHESRQAQEDSDDSSPRMMRMKHVPHVDKVDMTSDVEYSDDSQSEDKQSSSSSEQDATPEASSNDDDNEDADDSATVETANIETNSRVVHKKSTEAPGGGFTPEYSDDDSATTPSSSPASAPSSSSPSDSSPSTSSTDDAPRFTQSKRSVTHSLSSEKSATQAHANTMEVTEYDDSVQGGKRIDEDADNAPSAKEEADSK